jgi:hypothetical protein
MSIFEQGEVRIEVVQEMRALAEGGADVPRLVEYLQGRLGLQDEGLIIPAILYFRAAFCLSLREALPLREWVSGKDRSEVDSILIPAMRHTKGQWQSNQLQSV